MRSVSVPAIKAFEYRGRQVAAGDLIDLEPIEAAILARRQCVSLTRRHTYQTRDMVATVAESVVESVPESVEPEKPRRRRRKKSDEGAE